jgi:putative hydrolase of the HAD superfamily
MTLQAITFDFWGTLYTELEGVKAEREEQQVLAALDAFRRMRVRPAEEDVRRTLVGLYQRVDVLWRNEQRAMSGTEQAQWFGQQLGYDIEPKSARRVADMLAMALVRHPPVLRVGANGVLEAVEADYKLGLISDTGVLRGCAIREVLRRDQVLEYFQHLTFSDETLTTKPQPRQFLYTLQMLGVRPEQAVHVGDMEETDVAGAKACGMRAVLLSPDGTSDSDADAVIADLCELPDVLLNWSDRASR